mgnify:CR=1 FL=1
MQVISYKNLIFFTIWTNSILFLVFENISNILSTASSGFNPFNALRIILIASCSSGESSRSSLLVLDLGISIAGNTLRSDSIPFWAASLESLLYVPCHNPPDRGAAGKAFWVLRWEVIGLAALGQIGEVHHCQILKIRLVELFPYLLDNGRAFWALRWGYAAVTPCNAKAGLPSARE